MATLNFDASQFAPDTGVSDPVPKGWYNVFIDETEMKPTSRGDGFYLNVRHNIMDGQFAGRKVFARINVRNPNPQAQEIGYKQLSAICHAVGVIQIQDSSQLHNIPLKIRVKVRTDKTGEYEDQNDITAWKNINEPVPTNNSQATPTFAAPAAPAAPVAAPQPFAPPVAPAAAPQQWQQQAPAAAMAAPAAPAQQQWQPPATAQPWQQAAPQQAPAAPPAPPAAPAAPAPQQAPAAPPAPPAAPAAPAPQQFAAPPQATAPAAPPVAPAAQPWNAAQQATPPWQQPQQ